MRLKSRNIIFSIFLNLITNICWASEYSSKEDSKSRIPIEFINKRFIESQYFTIGLEEFAVKQYPKKNAPNREIGGGAVAKIDENELLYISASGESSRINVKNNTYIQDYLPKIETGSQDISRSNHYSFIETAPRILGVVYKDYVVYATYNYYDKVADKIYFCISKISTHGKAQWVEIWRSIPLDVSYFSLSNGGKLSIFKDKLFFSVGDQGLDRVNGMPSDFAAQNMKVPWGKIMFIQLSSKNPKPKICSIGHRNPQGLFITKDGQIFATEHGPRGGDEINVIKCGKNYGWPHVSYGTSYENYGAPTMANPKNERRSQYEKLLGKSFNNYLYEKPIYYYTPSIAITSIIKINNIDSRWNENLVVGSLKSTSIFRMKLSNLEGVENVEQIQLNARVRDLLEIGDRILVLTDSDRFLILRKTSIPLLTANKYPALSNCKACHSLTNNSRNLYGPSLVNVYGELAKTDRSYEYSQAFEKGNKIRWTDENLAGFLSNPDKFIPGTKMPMMNFGSSYISEVILDLKKLKEANSK